jgi:L-seryl-tRNA(Ser) seleniumtransferase
MTIPVQRMLAMTAEEIRQRSDALADAVARIGGWRGEVVSGMSAVGGGSAPGVELPTWLVAVWKDGLTADALEERLRQLSPPIVARIERDRVMLDLRTVLPEEDAMLPSLLASL